jgi:hypothetical protein
MKTLPALAITLALVFVCTSPSHAEFLGFGKKEPIDLNDAASIVEMLKPLSKGDDYDVYLSLNAKGRMSLSIKLADGTEVRGWGYDLKSTLTDLIANLDRTSALAKSTAEGARAILNQGKPSQ